MSTSSSDRQFVTLALLALGALVLLPLAFVGLGTMGGPMMGGGWGHGMWGDGGAAPGWMVAAAFVVQVLFLVALVAVGYLIYRGLAGRVGDRDPALEELRMAYARGDLTEEEYRTRRERLREE